MDSDCFKALIGFISDNVIPPFISSLFTVIGGVTPIAILIYFFSRKEKRLLLAHAEEIERSLPVLEQLLNEMVQVIEQATSRKDLIGGLEGFKQYADAQKMIEEHKKFIKYARNYNFMSAIGHILRISNYMPKTISDHREISKNFPAK